MLRKLGFVSSVIVGALVLGSGCGGDDTVDFEGDPDAAAGSSGVGGSTGGSGGSTGGTGGSTGGTGGSTGGSGGSIGGSAGSTGGSAGSTGGSAGSTGGSAGSSAGSDGGTGLPLGSACQSPNACASGHCADGVCCDDACTGTCQSCSAEGACTAIAANSDPDGECGDCKVCDGLGACASVPDGTDPNDDCATQASTTCGTTGTCKGGACELYSALTICGAGTCSVSTLTAQLCDGKGACGAVGTVSCSPYTCNAALDGCRTSCSSSTHCVPGVACDLASGVCLANLANGKACTGDTQCASGFCTDGVCCDKNCNGFCEACDLAPTPGTCKPVASGQDPDGECGGQGACNGTCDGSGGCSWPSGVSCTLSSGCSGGFTGPGQCNGYGLCAPTTSCNGNFACSSSSSCGSFCTSSQGCQKGYSCSLGDCVKGTIATGSACGSEGSCQTGDCADPFSANDCPAQNLCVACDEDTDCPSGRCEGCACEDRLKSGQACNESNDCLSGACLAASLTCL